jgi:hypothetical protein
MRCNVLVYVFVVIRVLKIQMFGCQVATLFVSEACSMLAEVTTWGGVGWGKRGGEDEREKRSR